MKTMKIVTSALLLFVTAQAMSQTETTGILNATTTNTFNYMSDGVQLPYTVKVEEIRAYEAKFNNETDKTDPDRVNSPTQVYKLITIQNKANAVDNKVISLQYEKQVTDAFELVSTKQGFVINVNEMTMEYTMGKGLSYPSILARNFFILSEIERK